MLGALTEHVFGFSFMRKKPSTGAQRLLGDQAMKFTSKANSLFKVKG